jgi:hypothetical protein
MAYVAAWSGKALGETYNVIDREHTTIEAYYRMLIDRFLPERKEVRSVTLPYCIGWMIGAASTFLSNLLDRDKPLFEPSLYGLKSVSSDLDFSHEKAEKLLAEHGMTLIDSDTAWERYSMSLALQNPENFPLKTGRGP